MYYIVCYDISNSKLRNRVAKELQLYGKRVQHSVFEIYIKSAADFDKLKQALSKELDSSDSIRIYHFPENARARSISFDNAPIAYFSSVIIV